MAKIKINCLNCEKETYVETREINRGFGKFCSKKCCGAHKSKNKKIKINNVSCAYCKVQFYLNKSKRRNSKSGLYFCCREHKDLSQRIGGIKEIMPSHYKNGIRSYRKIAFRLKQEKCERCGYNENIVALIIHHKDKNRENGDISNLEVLCANCHAIEHWS